MFAEAIFLAYLGQGLPPCTTNFVRVNNRIVCEDVLEVLPPPDCFRKLGVEICIAEKRTVRRNEPLTKGLQRSVVKIAPKPVNKYSRPAKPTLVTRPTQRSLRQTVSTHKTSDETAAYIQKIREAQKQYMLEKLGQ